MIVAVVVARAIVGRPGGTFAAAVVARFGGCGVVAGVVGLLATSVVARRVVGDA